MTDGTGFIGFFVRRLRAARGAEDGITLIELMVAVAVFSVIMGGALMGFSGAFRLTRDDRSRSVAANLGSEEMDTVRAMAISNFDAIPIGTILSTHVVDGVTYNIKRRDKWITTNSNGGPCDGASNFRASELSVKVTVTWPNQGDTANVTSQTVLTPPVGTYDPESGSIGVKVLDQTTAGVANIPVEVTGASFDDTEVTQSDGCAFFGFIPPGTYTIILNSFGYVTDQGVQNPTQTVTVTVGTILSVQFNYAQASTLDLTMSGKFGGTMPSTVPVTVGNTHLLPTGIKTIAGSGTSRSVGSLYPFTDGYQVWGGGCLDADPQAQKSDGSGAFYPGATRASPIGVTAGAHSSGTVVLDTAIITVTKAGVPQPGLTVIATHASDSGCSSGVSYTLGTTDASGVMTAALPFGLWTFSVSGKSPVGSWPSATLSPLDAVGKVVSAVIQ